MYPIRLESQQVFLSNNTSDRARGVPCSPLAQQAKAVLGHYVSTCVKSQHGSYATVQPSERLLKTLNKKNPVLKTLSRVFTGKRTNSTLSTKQANKTLAANVLQTSVLRLIHRGPKLRLKEVEKLVNQQIEAEYTDLYATSQTLVDQKQLKQYVHKAAPSALRWLKNSAGAIHAVQQSIRQQMALLKQQTEAQGLDWSVVRTTQDIRDAVAREIHADPTLHLHPNVLSEVLDAEFNTQRFVTSYGTELQISRAYLESKGNVWVEETLPMLVNNLELQIEDEIQHLYNSSQNQGMDWDDVIHTQNLSARLMNTFSNSAHNSLVAEYPEILRQLSEHALTAPERYRAFYTTSDNRTVELQGPDLKSLGKVWRTQTFPTEAKRLEEEALSFMSNLSKGNFENPDPPISDKDIRTTLKAYFLRNNALAKAYPPILETILDTVFAKQEAVDGLRLFYQTGFSPEQASFKGGYLKKGEHFQNTRVKAASGKVYELLNTLTQEDSAELLRQHNISKIGKMVLGEGSFGKVRLGRDIATGELVAVKKFQPNEQRPQEQFRDESPETLAQAEVAQFQKIKRLLIHHSIGHQTLASMRDYAHVGIVLPQSNATNPASSRLHRMLSLLGKRAAAGSSKRVQLPVGKSYIFMDLANQGDGKAVLAELEAMRQQSSLEEAHLACLDLAIQYAQAVADMHDLNLTHRDIKPANFLHTKDPRTGASQAKLADFGFALDQRYNHVFAGRAPRYIPPEAINGRESSEYNAAAHDAFSLGMVLFELRNAAFGNSPLDIQLVDGNRGPANVYRKQIIQKGINLGPIPLRENHLDNLIAKLLSHDKATRSTPRDAYHELLNIKLNYPKKSSTQA